jgi:hypothetical protein
VSTAYWEYCAQNLAEVLTWPEWMRGDMGKRYMTADEVVALMRQRQGKMTQREFASRLGITPQFLNDIYLRKRDPGEKALATLALERIVLYRSKVQ